MTDGVLSPIVILSVLFFGFPISGFQVVITAIPCRRKQGQNPWGQAWGTSGRTSWRAATTGRTTAPWGTAAWRTAAWRTTPWRATARLGNRNPRQQQ